MAASSEPAAAVQHEDGPTATWAVRGTNLWSDGTGNIAGGTVVFADGRIEAVGADISIPKDARILEVAGGYVLPGFLEAHSQSGLHGDGVGWDTDEDTTPITANLHAIDAYYPFAADVATARRAGITTMLVSPGGKNLVGGTAALVKTSGVTRREIVVRQPAAMKFSLGEEPKRDSSEPRTRMGEMAMLRRHFADAAAYDRAQRAAAESGEDFVLDPDLHATAAVLRGEIPALFQAYRAQDISNALRLSEEFGFDLLLAYAAEGHLVADELAERGVPVILTSMKGLWYRLEKESFSEQNAALLLAAGVPIALQQGEGNPYGSGELLFNAGRLLQAGFDDEDALRAITSWPAEILGIAHRVGRLAPGMDADVVVLSGPPFDLRSKVLHVFINGEPVCEHE